MSDSTVNDVTNYTTSTLSTFTRITYSNHEDYVELMPSWGYAASAFVLFIIGFFGFFLNLMVIILMCKDKQLWTPLNLILFNLVCSDFSVSILGNPFTLISALSHRWIFGRKMCVLYGFFMTLLGITSITTLTVLSFERYMMVSRPLFSHHLSMRRAYLAVVLIWCYSLALTTPPLLGWGNFVNEAANISCSINWEEQTFNTLTYILFLFGMGLILPVTIITFSYMNIIRTLKKNSMRTKRVTKAESRVTTMVFVMIVTFLVAWTPYSILALIEQFAPHDLVSPGLGVVPALVAKSSICYDPIIYVGMNTQFRSSVKRIFGFDQKNDSIQEKQATIMSPTRQTSQYNDNNIKLEYLNPNNNTVLAVTIYKDEDYNKITYSAGYGDRKKNSKEDNGRNKVTLTGSSNNDDSTEIFADSYSKNPSFNEVAHICEHKFTSNSSQPYKNLTNNTNQYSITKLHNKQFITTKTSNSNTLINTNNAAIAISENFDEKESHSSNFNGSKNDYISEEMLLGNDEYKRVTDEVGVENRGLNVWEDIDTSTREFLKQKSSGNVCLTKESEILLQGNFSAKRRKSLACAHFVEPKVDLSKMRHTRERRSSSSALAGHTKRLSTTLHETKGTVVTKLMVDERDMSKYLCFKETKGSFKKSTKDDPII